VKCRKSYSLRRLKSTQAKLSKEPFPRSKQSRGSVILPRIIRRFK
jgi:hypothetical protein